MVKTSELKKKSCTKCLKYLKLLTKCILKLSADLLPKKEDQGVLLFAVVKLAGQLEPRCFRDEGNVRLCDVTDRLDVVQKPC